MNLLLDIPRSRNTLWKPCKASLFGSLVFILGKKVMDLRLDHSNIQLFRNLNATSNMSFAKMDLVVDKGLQIHKTASPEYTPESRVLEVGSRFVKKVGLKVDLFNKAHGSGINIPYNSLRTEQVARDGSRL